jgi:acyl-CoA thioester hydrolase
VEARGLYLPVREASVRYRRPARYDDELFVRAGVGEWGRASLTFAYEVWGPPEGSTLIATGATQHACATAQGKPVPVPDWLRELFGAA